MSVGVGVSVHVMTCYALAGYGTPDQQARYLPEMLGGRPARRVRAVGGPGRFGHLRRSPPGPRRGDEGYALSGAKAWITHGSQADFYTTFARTSDDRTQRAQLLPGARRRARA